MSVSAPTATASPSESARPQLADARPAITPASVAAGDERQPTKPLAEIVREMAEARPPCREPLRVMPLSETDRLRGRIERLEGIVANLSALVERLERDAEAAP